MGEEGRKGVNDVIDRVSCCIERVEEKEKGGQKGRRNETRIPG